AAQPEDSIRRQSDAADLDRTFENPKASIFRSALEQQFFENLKASIFRSALEQQFFENLKASILGTDETLSSRLAREEIKREAARRLCLDLDPLALPSLLRHPSSDTQNSAAQPEDSIRRQSDAADLDRTAAAVKIQTLGRDYIARKLQKAEKAKAEARPAAAAFLTNITQQAVAQYANQTQVSHRTPASLSTATSIKKAHWTFIQASHILAPVTRGGSAADFPPLTNEMQNKSARRRNLKPLSN
ncbi:MAG: hypothetical protein KGQ54_04955, partial [Verrucomicrobia bacterium]|nr:hypothetical protein [Verrucomicrobiota bacterium]